MKREEIYSLTIGAMIEHKTGLDFTVEERRAINQVVQDYLEKRVAGAALELQHDLVKLLLLQGETTAAVFVESLSPPTREQT